MLCFQNKHLSRFSLQIPQKEREFFTTIGAIEFDCCFKYLLEGINLTFLNNPIKIRYLSYTKYHP